MNKPGHRIPRVVRLRVRQLTAHHDLKDVVRIQDLCGALQTALGKELQNPQSGQVQDNSVAGMIAWPIARHVGQLLDSGRQTAARPPVTGRNLK